MGNALALVFLLSKPRKMVHDIAKMQGMRLVCLLGMLADHASFVNGLQQHGRF